MPKYYCDYCDTFLTHDSPSVRKTHCGGRKHKENVRFYYQKWLEEQAQTLIDSTTASLKAAASVSQPPAPLVNPGVLPPGFPPGVAPLLRPPALHPAGLPVFPPGVAGLPPGVPGVSGVPGLPPGVPGMPPVPPMANVPFPVPPRF